MQDFEAQLVSGASALGIRLEPVQQTQLLDYLALLNKWNKAYNLTAVRDPQEMLSRHLLDSLSILPFVHAGNWLDVGSGGGMPGIILAIMFPDSHFTLLDSNGKKTRFLTQVRLELGLDNLAVVNARVEAFRGEQPWDGIVSRAFSSLTDFVQLTRHLGNSRTRWLAMKGRYPDDELEALPVDFRLLESHQLQVPGCTGSRHVLILAQVEGNRP